MRRSPVILKRLDSRLRGNERKITYPPCRSSRNAITPATIDLALAALTSLEERDREIGAQWQMRIERARYDTDLAERRYEAVDPANRLIAAVDALDVDAREATRKIFHSRLTIPVEPGPLTLLSPKWLPGEHGPTGPIVQMAGLHISANGQPVRWSRDPVEMYAMHVDVPAGATAVDVDMDYLNPVGTGPFRFVSFASGDKLQVTRNENYWKMGVDGKSLPYLDGVTYRVIIEATTQFNEMRAGTSDFAQNILGRDVPAAKQIANAHYTESPFSGNKRQYFCNSLKPPFQDNLNLRQAIHSAVDRDAIPKAVGGGFGFPLPYEFVPGAIGYDTSVPFYEFNIIKLGHKSFAPCLLLIK